MVPPDVFPVWVSLPQFFRADDARARCVLGAARGRRVRWLTRRLRRTLRLPARVALRLRGHLLPPAESLALLQAGDELEAIPAVDGVVDLSREASPSPPSPPPPASPPSPGPAPEDADAESLVEMKRRALHLLEQAELEAGQQARQEAGERAPRRRRRVRRRRAPPAAVFVADEPEPSPPSPPSRAGGAPSSPRAVSPPPADAVAVVRGARGVGGAPRCVRALSSPAPCPFPSPLPSPMLAVLPMSRSSETMSIIS